MNLLLRSWCFLAIFMGGSSPFLHAQSADAIRSIFDYYYYQPADLPVVSIATDMRQLINQKYKEQYQPATLAVSGDEARDCRVRARGNQRKEVCFYPPVRIKFNKSRLTGEGLLPSNDIKLVNQCKNTPQSRAHLLKEYVAYRIYRLLTPYSLRVRLVELDYYDQKREKDDVNMLGLLLEPVEDLCARLDAIEVDRSSGRVTHLEQEFYDRLCLFQYMIGNTDWNVTNMHNLMTVKARDYNRLVPIPYDFDYAGIVETDYALPHVDLPIKRVTEPYHMGASLDPENLDRYSEEIRSLEPAIREACREIAAMDERAAREAEDFVDSFFELLDNKKRLAEIFIEKKQ